MWKLGLTGAMLCLLVMSTQFGAVASTPAQRSGTPGFQLGLKALQSVDPKKGVTRETRRLCDEAIAQLEREIEAQGYIDPVNNSDRVAPLYGLYEACGYWDKAVSLFERVLEEGDTDSVRYNMAVTLLPQARERANASASGWRFSPILLIVACGAVLFLLLRRRPA